MNSLYRLHETCQCMVSVNLNGADMRLAKPTGLTRFTAGTRLRVLTLVDCVPQILLAYVGNSRSKASPH